jgi:DNA-binding response OmpR family regulator
MWNSFTDPNLLRREPVMATMDPQGSQPFRTVRTDAMNRATNRPERFLIVDDNKDSAGTLALVLEQLGRNACVATDGEDALRAGRTFQPDIVLLDLVMPKLDGFETCRRMREQKWGAQACIIAYTGWSGDDEYYKAKEAGFNAFLVKPLAASALQELVEGLIPRWEDEPFWRYLIRTGN